VIQRTLFKIKMEMARLPKEIRQVLVVQAIEGTLQTTVIHH
jgi:hypothetical protein